ILLQAGQPVIADFGIALAVSNAGGARITQTGLSLGTPMYMSPEQATGDRVIDGRTDIYSLAAMLYEMLTGDPPHTASTSQGIIAKVLTDRPRGVRGLRSSVPEHVEEAIDHALEKLPADRWASAQEFLDALQGRAVASSSSRTAALRSGMVARRTSRVRDPVFLATAALAVAAVAWGAWSATRTRTSAAPPIRFTLTPDTGASPNFNGTWSVVPSPDGRLVVYTAVVRGTLQLVARPVDQLQGRPIVGTEHASQPMFSPDGKWLAFEADGKLKKVLIDGGTAVTLTDAGGNNGGDWSVNDVIVLGSEGKYAGLSKVASAGGAITEFTKVDAAKGENSHLWPVVLPDGNTVVFAIWDGKSKAGSRIGITSLKDGKVTNLGVPGIAPVGVFEGQLVYVQADGAVMAAPIDVGGRRLTGNPVPILDPVMVCPGCNGDAAVHASRSGVLAYMHGSTLSRLVWVDKGGGVHAVRQETAAYATPRLSPDGTRIAVEIAAALPDIWILNIATGTLSRLTSGGGNQQPEWTPDGKSLLFASDRGGKPAIWRQPADGSGSAEKLADGVSSGGVPSPDGKNLLFERFSTSLDVMLKTIGDTQPARAWLATPAHEQEPRFSPDGHWVAYQSNETGTDEVYVRAFQGDGGRVQVSAGGGVEPRWAADGRRIFYRIGRRMMSANVVATPAFGVTTRDTLFDGLFAAGNGVAGYDVTRDGSRFLMLKGNEDDMQVVVVMNWLSELRARTGKK
ncbi:MAG: protein kinase, partial [Gemmatimonadales bacterium]